MKINCSNNVNFKYKPLLFVVLKTMLIEYRIYMDMMTWGLSTIQVVNMYLSDWSVLSSSRRVNEVDWRRGGWIVILESCEYYFIRVDENLE